MPAIILIIPLLACWWDQSHHNREYVHTPKTALSTSMQNNKSDDGLTVLLEIK